MNKNLQDSPDKRQGSAFQNIHWPLRAQVAASRLRPLLVVRLGCMFALWGAAWLAPAQPAGLVAAYAFDEGTGTTVADYSGQGNNGMISGATWTSSGRFGNALVFNGSSDWVTINDSATLRLTNAMTLEAWVYPTAVDAVWRDVIYKGNDNYYLEATTTASGVACGGGTFGGTNANAFGTALLPANTWTHLAATYDGATLRFFVNGVQDAIQSQTGSILTSANPLQIGGDSIYGQFFEGRIDEVRVYDLALSADQIQSDMTNAIVGGANRAPVAMASATPTGGLTPLNVAFSSAGSFDPDGTSLTWNWSFGDGSPPSAAANPIHTYTNSGIYSAQLTVSDGTNATPASVIIISVGSPEDPLPTVAFTLSNYLAAENGGPVTIPVQLSKPYYLDVYANFTVAGLSASPGVDFITNSGVLHFAPAQTNASFAVTLINSDVRNPEDRMVQLSLGDFISATAGDPTNALLVILDDEAPPRLVSPRTTTNGLFAATALGVPGRRFAIEYSQSLTQWATLATLTNLAYAMDFTDLTSNDAGTRFYRTASGHRGMFTHHNDNFRTGQNLNETTLTPASVNSATFGKITSYALDGITFSSPIYAADVDIPGLGLRNVVYVATEHDSLYAFDADSSGTNALWQLSFINPAAGITTVPAVETGETGDIPNEIGITGTPVIDPMSDTLYVVVKTKEVAGGVTNYPQRLHALDLAAGTEKFGGPILIQATVPGTGVGSVGGQLPFLSLRQLQRPGLLLVNGVVYIGFASHGDNQPYHGWILGYDATTLTQVMAFCATPDEEGGGIWQGGGGLSADADGNLHFVTGDGTFTADTGGRDYGDSFVKLSPGGVVLDYFTPYDQATLDAGNHDLGSANALLLPDQPGLHPRLVSSAGKNNKIYLLDRDNMGGFNAGDDSQIVQTISVANANFICPVYFNGHVYYSVSGQPLADYQLTDGLLSATPTSQSAVAYGFPGGALAISATGTNSAILWAVQRKGGSTAGTLHAYDAYNLATEFYHSDQAGERDTLDIATKYSVPLVFNGRVYVATLGQLTVYGLLP